jgi:hypothetical protein
MDGRDLSCRRLTGEWSGLKSGSIRKIQASDNCRRIELEVEEEEKSRLALEAFCEEGALKKRVNEG